MKIYVNRKPVSGPWGGGNKFLTTLIDSLKSRHEITHRLSDDLDVIICIDPRPSEWGDTIHDIFAYRHKAKLICRLGDVGTHGKPQLTKLWKDNIDKFDVIVAPSNWAVEQLCPSASILSRVKVIHNAPLNIFHKYKHQGTCDGSLITHHWSDNELKGFSLYYAIQSRCKFTYVGRKPQHYNFKNYVGVLDAVELSRELSKHSIYLTASKFEAGANHVLEAMACGLPVIYSSQGGSIVEYCNDYGIEYDSWDVESCIHAIEICMSQYEHYKEKVLRYNATVDDTVNSYMKLVCE